MELKEFITESLKQITDGLIESHHYIKEKSPGAEGINNGYRTIKFDIGVETNDGSSNEVGGKINVAQIFNAGGKSEAKSSSTQSNRIVFDVLLCINHK